MGLIPIGGYTLNTVTIVTPAYNCVDTIEEVVLSVTQEAGQVLEYILINDGSTDGTLKCLRDLEIRFAPLIRVIDQNNSGEGAAVNRGIEESSGDLVMIVNADDPISPGCVSQLRQALIDDQEAVVAYGDWKMIDGQGKLLKVVRTLPFSKKTLIADWVCIVGPGAMIRRNAFGGEPARNTNYKNIADYEMWLRLAQKGTFVRVDKVLSTWRNHITGASWNGRGKALTEQYDRLHKEFFSRHEISDQIRSWERRAKAHQLYYSAIQKLFDGEVKGRRYIMSSWLTLPFIRYEVSSVKRSKLVALSILTFPLSLRLAYFCKRVNLRLPQLIEDAVSKRYR